MLHHKQSQPRKKNGTLLPAEESPQAGLNHRPLHYRCNALPLSYGGVLRSVACDGLQDRQLAIGIQHARSLILSLEIILCRPSAAYVVRGGGSNSFLPAQGNGPSVQGRGVKNLDWQICNAFHSAKEHLGTMQHGRCTNLCPTKLCSLTLHQRESLQRKGETSFCCTVVLHSHFLCFVLPSGICAI